MVTKTILVTGETKMAHMIDNMFSVKEVPWHGLGTVVHDAPTIAEAFKLSGLDWEVQKFPLSRPGRTLADGTQEPTVDLSDFGSSLVRMDNGTTLGIVGPNTEILQNADSLNWFQPFLDAKEASLETAGSLDEGRKIWVMAKVNIPNAEIVKDDEVIPFVLLSNSHDGKQAVRIGFTPIRVVCANTLAAAHKNDKSKLIRLRHSKDVKKNLENVRDTMKLLTSTFEATVEQYKLLANKNINQNDLREYIKAVFKMNEDETELATRSKNILEKVLKSHEDRTHMLRDLAFRDQLAAKLANVSETADALLESLTEKFEAGLGTDNAASRGSYWTAYNAVTEELNYGKGHNQESRLNSLWFGPNKKTSDDALELALEMATS